MPSPPPPHTTYPHTHFSLPLSALFLFSSSVDRRRRDQQRTCHSSLFPRSNEASSSSTSLSDVGGAAKGSEGERVRERRREREAKGRFSHREGCGERGAFSKKKKEIENNGERRKRPAFSSSEETARHCAHVPLSSLAIVLKKRSPLLF